MGVWRKLNPFEWSRATVVRVFLGFFAVGLPLWFSGLSAFATTINSPNASLRIAEIGLNVPVTPVEIMDGQLETPEKLVGSYTNGGKVFLYGHNTGVFRQLDRLAQGDWIWYGEGGARQQYIVERVEVLPVEEVKMSRLLADDGGSQLVLMTCAGKSLGDGDATHRLVVFARRV